MQDSSPENGIKTIWLNQPTEIPEMTSRFIEQRSRELRTGTRRRLIGTMAGPLSAGLFYAYGMNVFTGLRHVLQAPFAFALAWSIAGLYFLNRGMWSTLIPGNAGLSTGLESCRREIERQRDFVRRALLWSLAPIVLAIGTFVAALWMAGGIFPGGLPFLILVAAWIVSWFAIRLRDQRQLQRAIDELDDIELKNR